MITNLTIPCITIGKGWKFEPDRFLPITFSLPTGRNKPDGGGLWASPITARYGWWHYIDENPSWTGHYPSKSFSFIYRGLTLCINNETDLVNAPISVRKYENPVLDYAGIDYNTLISRGIKAVYVTYNGVNIERFDMTFSGWDCDSLIIFDPKSIIT